MFQNETNIRNLQGQLDAYKEFSEELEEKLVSPIIERVNGRGYVCADALIILNNLEVDCVKRMDILGMNAIRKFLSFISLVAYYGDRYDLYNAEEYTTLVETEISILAMEEELKNIF